MKKLYYLDESEKERILNLHESRTKKQYLMNESQWWDDIKTAAVIGATTGGAIGIAGGGVGALPGALIGGALGGLSALFNTSARPDFKKQITTICTSGGLGNPIDDTKLDTITAELKKLIETTNYTGVGRATSQSEQGIKAQLSQIQSVPDLCQVIKRYGDNYNADLMDKLSGEFYVDDAWNTYVRLPLMGAVRKSQKLSKEPAETLMGWDNFPCVTKNPNAKKSSLKDGSVAYDLNNFYYYGNGRKMNKTDSQMSSYHCVEGSIQEGPKPAGGGGGGGTGGGSNLSARVSAIQTKLGLPQSGKMDQPTINALMTKLQGGGSSTPNTPTTPQSNVVTGK